MIRIPSKLPNVGTTIFTRMSAMAAECGAINLSQGFPDFEPATELIEAVNRHMRSGHNQYAPMAGVPALREAIAAKISRLYGLSVDPEHEVTVTAGATQAIFTAITASLRDGDEVIVVEPAYDCYVPAIRLCGAEPVFVQLEFPEFRIDWDKVRRAINGRTRMIIINSPHNPSGSAMDAADLAELARLTRGTDILILSDEVYEHMRFDGIAHASVLAEPELAERCFAVFSFGKTYHNTGWKVGYCVAPKALMRQFRLVHQFLVFSVNTPVQHALAEYMADESAYLSLSAFYQAKRDRFNALLEGSRFSIRPSAGTYFQLLDYSAISEEKDTDFAERLTREHGVASIPISVFYRNGEDNRVLRFCFAKNDETLERAAEKLHAI